MARCCLLYLLLYLLSLLILADSTRLKLYLDHGKQEHKMLEDRKVMTEKTDEEASKIVFGGGMVVGSRPPRCPPRCASCVHCEAIQMPAIPRIKLGKNHTMTSSTSAMAGDTANYKPMSWKCKCGDSIYNP